MLRPKHPCQRCPALTTTRYCEAHTPKRPSARAAGYTSQWDRYSKAFLAKHKICADPFGLHRGNLVTATVTGHKVAHKGDNYRMWDRANHYPLCTACNAYQCVKLEGGFGNSESKANDYQQHSAVGSDRPLPIKSGT